MINNEYYSSISKKDITGKSVILAKNIDDKLTVIVKSSEDLDFSNVFKTDHLLLKTCSHIYIDEVFAGVFHIITCISEDLNIERDFMTTISSIFSSNTESFSANQILDLFTSINNIFTVTPERDTFDLQVGVFGELFSIKVLEDNGFYRLIDDWHSNFYTKHDIEIDKKNRIEIKATSKTERIHEFNHDQISRKDVNVYVVSLILEITEKGLSLSDLMDIMINRTTSLEKKITIELLRKKCGLSQDNKGICVSEELAINKMKIFDAKDLPQISSDIPDTISNIRYNVDCTFINSINIFEFIKKFKTI